MLHLLLFVLFVLSSAEPPESERQALLAFLSRTPHGNRLSWNPSSSACSWKGIRCDPSHSSVNGLHLPGTGLSGNLSLPALPSLRSLSLRDNRLSGPLPDLSNFTALRRISLQRNLFSGAIPTFPPSVDGLDLSSNLLDGEIPFSLNNLENLTFLYLDNNRFSGNLPTINISTLASFNVSQNKLAGPIPVPLSRFPEASFVGNLDLCGKPLKSCPVSFPSSPSPKKSRLSTGAIVGIIVAAVVLLLIFLLACALLLSRRKKKEGNGAVVHPPRSKENAHASISAAAETPTPTATGTSSTSKDDMRGVEKNKLVFVGKGAYSFDLEDLLRASAEVLGKGVLGTSYKAVLEDSTVVVVKRLRDVAVDTKAFETHMAVLGNVKPHPNVVPLRAFYYSRDEKLLVYDYLTAGSLSALIHGGRASGQPAVDWEKRLSIAVDAARGLAHLHLTAGLPHGNLKASNVLLSREPEAAALSDYALNPLFAAAQSGRAAGYRAPEFVGTQRPTFHSDVYSFGVLLLELLTGKAPNQTSLGDDAIDLPRWVESVVREEWTGEVFDIELKQQADENTMEDMMDMLRIALSCVAALPDMRPDTATVVNELEAIGTRGHDWRAVSPAGPIPPAAATP